MKRLDFVLCELRERVSSRYESACIYLLSLDNNPCYHKYDLPRWDYRLLPHSYLQLYFDHLENDIDEYPDVQ